MNTNDGGVVKVKPYPFEASFESAQQQKFVGEVLKLTLKGFIVDLKKTVVVVGRNYQVRFVLPTKRFPLEFTAKVIKTYDQFRGKTESNKVDHLAEFHFVKPSEGNLTEIKSFLLKIGQISRERL